MCVYIDWCIDAEDQFKSGSHFEFRFYWDAIVPLPIDIANGFAIIPNDVFAEPDGVSCDNRRKIKHRKRMHGFSKNWSLFIQFFCSFKENGEKNTHKLVCQELSSGNGRCGGGWNGKVLLLIK